MKRILVPTDFSECSYYAAEVAAQLAKKTGARVFLLHALEVPQYSSNEPYPTMSNTAEGIFMMKLVKQEYEKLISQDFHGMWETHYFQGHFPGLSSSFEPSFRRKPENK